MASAIAASALPAARHGSLARLGEPAFPGEGVLDDSVEIVELRRPAELRAQALAVGDDRRRIARAAGGEAHGKIAAARALDGLDHFKDGTAVPVAAIERLVAAAAAQVRQAAECARARSVT